MKTNHNLLKILLTLYFVAIAFMIHAQDEYVNVKGIVFEDSNKNLLLDSGEKGIPDVLISNQHDVVKTNEDGEYMLQINNSEAILYVIKPRGYNVPLDENNLPRFYYIHKSQDSPKLKYPGMFATGEIPNRVNFPLLKTEPQDTFSFIAISDPQPFTKQDLEYYRDDIVSELVGNKADFSVVLGDIMYDDLSLFEPYNKMMSYLEMPVYNVSGNHDFNHYEERNHHTLETYKRIYGPAYYAFEYGKASFIIFNSVEWLDEKNSDNYRNYRGYIDEEQLNWFRNYLELIPDDQLLIFCMHVPFYNLNTNSSEHGYIANREELFEIVQDRKNLLSLFGHWHSLSSINLTKEMGWHGETPFLQLVCSAASGQLWKGPEDERGIPVATQKDGTPNGYHIININGHNYSQRFKAANHDENYQIRISSPNGIIKASDIDSVPIIANFFNGNTMSELTCQIDDAPLLFMNYTPMVDPFFDKLFSNNKKDYAWWMSVETSYHIWTLNLPWDIKPGIHRLIVTATDQYGYKYRQCRIFEIAE